MSAFNIPLAVAALAAVLGLIWLAQLVARRTGWVRLPQAARGDARLAVVQAVALDTRRRLHLVLCDGRHFVLLTGGAQDVVVGWIEPGTSP